MDKQLTKIPGFPGLQTYANLHHYEELKPLLKSLFKYITRNFIIKKCWANHTDGKIY